jgi:2-amino-4-hydroxy-6-hydroxymethyldihydropteridine diphosphokinase
MARVFLGLGTNLGDRRGNLRAARTALGQTATIESVSGVWETAPLYVVDQPAFLNMAMGIVTDLAPLELLRRLKALEDDLGRIASIRFGPRLIDLDILFYDQVVVTEGETLILPHPRLAERRFALAPLAEIAGPLIHPVLGESVTALLAKLPEDDDIRWLGAL